MSVTLHTTHGDIKIEVFCENAPKSAENFLALCASHYYDSSPFHRIIPTFIIQTGRPSHPLAPNHPSSGRSIYGTTFTDSPPPPPPPLHPRHSARGFVSFAHDAQGNKGSQFFITLGAAPHLDEQNTVFGKVIGEASLVALGKIEAVPVSAKGKPVGEVVMIKTVTIHANPLAG